MTTASRLLTVIVHILWRAQGVALFFVLSFLIVSCDQQVQDFVKKSAPSGLPGAGANDAPITLPTALWTASAQTTNKSAAAILALTIQLSASSKKSVTLPFTIGGSAVLNSDFAIIPTNSITIPAGQTSALVKLTIINDGISGSDKNIILTLGNPTNAILGDIPVQTITIVNDLIGNFNITGITGPSDATLDAFLNGGVNPTINWGASSGASSYDVTVYQSDGTSVQCALVNTAATSYAFSTCTLTAGSTYKAKVTAKGTGPAQNATNNLYSFFVNSPPTPAVIATKLVMMNSSIVFDVVTGATCAFAGCTISIASSANGGIGTTSFSGNNITYTPGASNTGTDSFSYVISDARGGKATGTINVKVMSPFTWTGGGANSSWATVNNWCGSLNVGKTACLGGVQPGIADTAVFDGTCTSNCSAVINSNVDIAALNMNSGYTGTITQSSTYTITLEAVAGFNQAAGIFVGGDSAITDKGKFILSGGNFTSTSNTLLVSSDFTIGTASFSAHGGLLDLRCLFACNILSGTAVFNNVTIDGHYGDYELGGSVMTINGNLIAGDTNPSYALNNGTLNVAGNITANNAGYDGTALIVAVGNPGGQTITGIVGANLPSLRIAAGANAVTLSGTVQVHGDYIVSSVGTLNTAGSTLIFDGYSTTHINPGVVAYNNVTFHGHYGIFELGGSVMTINGDLALGDDDGPAWSDAINAGTLNVAGNVTVINKGDEGTALIVLVGNASGQTITGIAGSNLPNLKIAAGANTVTLSGSVQIYGNYTMTSVGTFNVAGSTLIFDNDVIDSQIKPGTVAYNNVSFIGNYASFELNGATMTINGSLSAGGYNIGSRINSGTLNVAGDVTFNNNIGHAGTVLLNLVGTAARTLNICATCNVPTGNIGVNITGGGTLTLATAATFNSVGQTFSVTSGSINMAGFNLSLNALNLSTGTSISRNGGLLTVNGSGVGAGPYGLGNISN